MRLKLKTAPTVEPVTIDEAKLHCKIDGAADNALITDLITAARIIGEKETNRAFITQTWELYFDSPPLMIEIPKPPLQSITSIKILDDEGASSNIDPGDYIVDISGESYGRVRPDVGLIWPYHRGFASFIVEFICGYGDAAADVPEEIRRGILALIMVFYGNRGVKSVSPEDLRILFASKKIYTF